jgi:hypothetical protein
MEVGKSNGPFAILHHGSVILCSNRSKWVAWMKEAHAAGTLIIAEDSIEGYQVATVFFSSFRYGIAIEQVSPALQPAVRGDLVGVKEASPGLHGTEADQCEAPEQVCSAPVQLGEKARQKRNREHFAGRSPEYS